LGVEISSRTTATNWIISVSVNSKGTFDFSVLVFFDAEADNLVLDGLVGGREGVQMAEVEGQLQQVLAGLGVVELGLEGSA
jgi:hypothetical protein